MNRHRITAALAALGLAGGGLLAAGCRPASARETSAPVAAPIALSKAAPVQVTLVDAKAIRAAPSALLTGTLVPAKALKLGFEVGGRLAKVDVTKGQTVKKGQVLAALDTAVAQAQVAQAEAALQAAVAQADGAEDVASRTAKLRVGGSASEMQSHGSEVQARAAQAQVAAARAQLAQARVGLSKHTLRAPFAATLIDAPEQVGATVAPGAPLFTLEQLDPLILQITVPPSARRALAAGQKVAVAAVGGDARTDDARVRVVIPSAEASSHRVPVEVSVPNADGRFLAHTLAQVKLPLGPSAEAEGVPPSAVALAGGDHVFVLQGGVVKRVDVEVVERGADQVILRAPGPLSRVIDSPSEDLADGARAEAR